MLGTNNIDLIEDMPLIIDWNIRHQLAFVFEINTAIIRSLLPKGIEPFEARPGVGLMFLGYNDYYPGNLINGIEQPRFDEVTRFFMVQPDLSIDMPMPRFTFFVHRIGSNNQNFIDQEISRLHLPSFYAEDLIVETHSDKTGGMARTAGGPIQEWKNTNPDPRYYEDSFYGQYFTLQNNELWFGVWFWAGDVCTHQHPGDGGRIFHHPFLDDLEKTIQPEHVGNSYMQLITAFDKPLVQRFFEPRFIGSLV